MPSATAYEDQTLTVWTASYRHKDLKSNLQA